MSVYFNQTNYDPNDAFAVLNTNNINFISSINVANGSINTSEIQLDQIRMDCEIINGNPTLLLNGQPVAGVSSLTSSVTTWSSYPALTTVSYASAGGVVNMANVNALNQLSSATVQSGNVQTSTLNGVVVPNPGTAITSLASSTVISNGVIISTDFGAQPNGLYAIAVVIQTGGTDPFTCSCIVQKSGTGVIGGSTHLPSFAPYGAAPSLANAVIFQSASVTSTLIDCIIFSNNATVLGSTAQIGVCRIN